MISRKFLYGALCLLAVIFIGQQARAQWQTFVPFSGSVSNVQPLYIGLDGGTDYVVLTHVQAANSTLYLLRLDGNTGNILSQQAVSTLNTFRSLNDASPDGSGGFVACGRTLDPSDNTFKAYAIRINGAGAVSWEKYYSQTAELIKIIAASAGGFVCTARTTPNQFDLLRLQANGNVSWAQSYPIGAPDAADIIQLASGNFMVAATIPLQVNYRSAQTIEFDAVGNLLNPRLYNRSLYNDGFTSLMPTADGNFILSGFSQVVANRNEGWIIKVDPAGTKLWSAVAGTWQDDAFNCAIELGNGEIAATGNYGSFWNSSEMYLARCDGANGNLLFEQSYPATGGNPSSGYCLVEGPNNSVTVLGSANIQGIPLLMVGNYKLAVSSKNPVKEPPRLSVSPNPAGEQFTFQLEKGRYRKARLLLYDAGGALVREETWNGSSHTAERGQLKAGVYSYALESQGKRVASGILILQ